MRKLLLPLSAIILSVSSVNGVAAELNTVEQKASYAIGLRQGEMFKKQIDDLQLNAFVQGFKDAFGGQPAKLSDQEIQASLKTMQERAKAKQLKAGEDNKSKGEAFLAKVKADNKNVKETESGLLYEVLNKGDGKGEHPTASDTVEVHYEGTLINGEVFDSSIQRGQSISFPLGGVIPGWTEGVQLMKVGDKFKFYIKSELAYGPRGAGAKIGPNETLIFEVELLAINPAK